MYTNSCTKSQIIFHTNLGQVCVKWALTMDLRTILSLKKMMQNAYNEKSKLQKSHAD